MMAMMLLIIESTGRSLLLALAAYLLLRALKIRNERIELTIWRITFTAALLMPFALKLLPISLPAEVEVPAVMVAVESLNSVAPTYSWTVAIPITYSVVALVLFLRLGIGMLATWNLFRRGSSVRVDETFGVELRVGHSRLSPVTIGSTVLLPSDYATWDAYKLNVVIAHEAAHVKNHDFYWHTAALLYRAIFWINPLAWWLPKRMSDLAESRSDEFAVRRVGNRLAYAEVLLGLSKQPAPALIAVAMARGADLERRVANLIANDVETPVSGFTTKAMIGSLIVTAFVACASCERAPNSESNNSASNASEREARDSTTSVEDSKITPPTIDPNHPLSNPTYIASERKANHEGVVELSLLIAADGRVSDSRIKKSSGYELLDQEAEAHARGYWRMRPATRDGQPIELWVTVPVKFKLQNDAESKVEKGASNEATDRTLRSARGTSPAGALDGMHLQLFDVKDQYVPINVRHITLDDRPATLAQPIPTGGWDRPVYR